MKRYYWRYSMKTHVAVGVISWMTNMFKNIDGPHHKYIPLDEHNYKFKLDKIDTELHRKHSIELYNENVNEYNKQEIKDMAQLCFWLLVLFALIASPFVLFMILPYLF